VELESGDLAIEYHEAVHIGMATALPEGLVAPVIRNADHLNLSAVTAERKRLALAARQGRLAAEELSGATFTVSNLGSFGIHAFTAIINPPEAAILAVGRMADRVLARGGKPVVRPTLYLNLTVDHRLVDGATAAKFLTDLQVHLEFQERLASLIG
jgi:pyruvate dehydrogenase E2 component (dihydrolipoamide acetyltransferase)